jgi:hypothetical protein
MRVYVSVIEKKEGGMARCLQPEVVQDTLPECTL